nr:nitric oxide synthase-interacting protein [Ipomoea batatas]
MPSSSSIRDSAKPFFASEAEADFSGESLTLDTRIHWTSAKAMPTMEHTGIRTSVPRSGRIVEAPMAQENEEAEERLMLQKAREIDAFDQQNHSAVPQYNDKSYSVDKNGIHGANSVKATSYEEEALRTMKAFWLPSATPEAPVKVDAPSTSTVCPEGNEKLKLKNLFSIHFTEDTSEQKKTSSLDKSYICPSCKACKDRNVVNLEKGGTGFAAHGDNLEA